MLFEFTKMQALGNDYIIINGFKYPDLLEIAPQLSVRMSDRHFGIGGDGIIFALPSSKADATMRIFNADGSEAQMCGNGIRQVAKYVYDNKICSANPLRIDTLAGIKTIQITADAQGKMTQAVVDMGEPILDPKHIPAIVTPSSQGWTRTEIHAIDLDMDFTLVSMGNPHAVTFLPDIDNFDVQKYGRFVENSKEIFPERTNVEFIRIHNPQKISMRVWERGSGETLACGTGACASVVASVLNGHTSRKVDVELLGGTLHIEWDDASGKVFMRGDAVAVFQGQYESLNS